MQQSPVALCLLTAMLTFGVGCENKAPKPNKLPGIPDWVRVIRDSATSSDRKSFSPGDLIPVVVGSTSVIAGEVFPIKYEIVLPSGDKSSEPTDLFDRAQTTYEVTADQIGKAFGFVLRVKPSDLLTAGTYTVTIKVEGKNADGSTVEMPPDKTHEFHVVR